MIICEFVYCIYNKNDECILKHISISALGYCEDCILVDIDTDLLNKLKETIN